MDTLLSRITIDPAVCHGKPCVRGLRYPVETLLELLSSGMTIDEILADYEDLERDDLRQALGPRKAPSGHDGQGTAHRHGGRGPAADQAPAHSSQHDQPQQVLQRPHYH